MNTYAPLAHANAATPFGALGDPLDPVMRHTHKHHDRWSLSPEPRETGGGGGREGGEVPPKGMLSYCTWAQDVASTKTQKENWLVSGLKDHRYLSVTRMRHRGASGQATNTQSNGSQRCVLNHRQPGTIGPELLTTY